MRLKGSVRQINLLSLFFILNLNFVISTRNAKLAPVLTRENSIRVQGIFFGVRSSRVALCSDVCTQKTASLNQRYISLIYGQGKNSLNWRKFCWLKQIFFNVNKYISLVQRTFFWIKKTFFNSKKFFLWPYIKETVFSV